MREVLDSGRGNPCFPGELNYKISMLLDQYIATCGLTYTILNEVIGVLECAKLEVYRRLTAPYEDVKLYDHGEVYKNAIGMLPTSTKDFQLAEKATIEIVPVSGAKYGETKFGE